MAATSELSSRSPANKSSPASSARLGDRFLATAYERYLRLHELSKLRSHRDFPQWKNELLLKPSLQALEITFRLISLAIADPRPYSDHGQWTHRLESLAAGEIEIIAAFSEAEEGGDLGAPVADIRSHAGGTLARDRRSQEVWQLPGGDGAVVSIASEDSLLPRLASWEKSEKIARKIHFQIESLMPQSSFTLGLGEPNLTGKPILQYDLIVRPADLHSLKKPYSVNLNNEENEKLFTIHQILESWISTAIELVKRADERMDSSDWDSAARYCWLLERIWKLLSEIIDLHLLMDPDDLLRLKGQLAIRASSGSEAFCFRSAALGKITDLSRELKRRVPGIIGAEADLSGVPRLLEAAMRLFHERRRGEMEIHRKIHLLQAFQAVETAVKKFYFGYRQVVAAAMGSLEAAGSRPVGFSVDCTDKLSQMFLESPYFPSLDAAKTFLGEIWQKDGRGIGSDRRT